MLSDLPCDLAHGRHVADLLVLSPHASYAELQEQDRALAATGARIRHRYGARVAVVSGMAPDGVPAGASIGAGLPRHVESALSLTERLGIAVVRLARPETLPPSMRAVAIGEPMYSGSNLVLTLLDLPTGDVSVVPALAAIRRHLEHWAPDATWIHDIRLPAPAPGRALESDVPARCVFGRAVVERLDPPLPATLRQGQTSVAELLRELALKRGAERAVLIWVTNANPDAGR